MSDAEKISIAPVVFMIFNRPDVTRRVFEEIRKAKPSKLFIIADGPRTDAAHADEAARCEATRAIVETIDWDCEVFRNYSDLNLGCKDRISSGITWVFTQIEEAIFLEDDCLPQTGPGGFFAFCTEMLERYRDETRVMHISGDNFQQKNLKYEKELPHYSYYFSRIPHVWGWATWRRAWSLYDVGVKKFHEIRDMKSLSSVLPSEAVRLHWEHVFSQYYARTINSWDGQWVFCCLTHDGLCIMPRVNLVSNIGFGKDATHTNTFSNPFGNIPTETLLMPLIHPTTVAENSALDAYTYTFIYGINRYAKQRLISFAKNHFPSTYRLFKNLFS